MGRYYFAIAALPPLSIGHKPEMSYEEVRDMLSLNLTEADWKEVVLFQRLVDIRNIRALWLEEPLDQRGNFGEKELEEAILVRDGELPPFVADFLERYETQEERLRYFLSLYASLYSESANTLKGFLKAYYRLEREIRLVLTLLRAKRSERDLTRELQFEDPIDPFVAEILAQKEGREVVVPQEYEELKTLFLENSSEPKKLHLAILQYRFDRIVEMEADNTFAMDQILGYLARLSIVEAWDQLNEDAGKAVLEQMSK